MANMTNMVLFESSTETKTPTFWSYEDVDSLREIITLTLNVWVKEDRIPSPVKFADELHKHLVICGHLSAEDHILYDFDEHYKLKFTINDVRYYFETWSSWMGALNWKIEEDIA